MSNTHGEWLDRTRGRGRRTAMSIDKSIHEVYEKLNNGYIRWHDFQEIGVNEHYYQWYYAEDRLYVIRDVMTGEWWFVMARSPVNALAMYKERLSEVARAGAWKGEEHD